MSQDRGEAETPLAQLVISAELDATKRELQQVRRERDRLLVEEQRARRDQVTFLALVAHQLKAPLLPLDVSLRAIQRALDRGRELPADTLVRARRQSRRLTRLTDALLVDLPRAEEGTLTVKLETIDAVKVVKSTVDELCALVESRVFEFSAPKEPVYVFADAERVAQIVGNLLDNAVKYSPPGSAISVTIEAGSECRVSVVDHGIGIPPGELSHLFSRFHRASNAPPHLYRGLGVGLFLSRKLAELCHGTLVIRSEEGSGTEATLVLPIVNG
jgi:signal transduction histidine kinase